MSPSISSRLALMFALSVALIVSVCAVLLQGSLKMSLQQQMENELELRHAFLDPLVIMLTVPLSMTGALLALRSIGLTIPRDVSLIGFDDFDLATFTDPQITVVAQPVGKIGPVAVKMLLERIRGLAEPPRHVRFQTRLICRGSVSRIFRPV